MQKLIDKLALFGLCLLAMSFTEIQWLSVVTMLAAVTVSSLCGYFEERPASILCAGYAVLCLLIPELVLFLPLIAYDCGSLGKLPLRLCWLVALPAVFMIGMPQAVTATVLTSGAAFLLQHRTAAQLKTRADYFTLMDSAKERAELLERKNRDLMEKQDYEVKLATMAERNRIAREIHDNVGHLLTRSLLQLSALKVAKSEMSGELDTLRDTLSEAMDSIRESVHDLHDDSVDLKSRLEAMIDGFTFCPVKLRYDAGELPTEVKYCFSAIVREALSNIARHSNASSAAVTVTEHPAFCQLLISDNGTEKTGSGAKGIGLQTMADRVEALGGIFRVETDKGFRIFISTPKGESQ